MADDCAVVFEPDYLASCGGSLLVTALLPLILVVYGSSGNAPTPVGYTLKIKQSLGYVKDHPHTCGEYQLTPVEPLPMQGSPPHLWGIPVEENGVATPLGITPTPVGNTFWIDQQRVPGQDHPHTCGEYLKSASQTKECLGSPPHLWGIH